MCQGQAVKKNYSRDELDMDIQRHPTGIQISLYPLVMTNSLLLNIAIEIVDFPIKHCHFQ